MEVNVPILKKTIVNKNTTLEAVANNLGIDRSTLYRRLKNGASGITLSDAQRISHYLDLAPEEALSIFWGKATPSANVMH